MKCPICGKELELKNKQIGTNENGDPIFNEYAICRDCRKQWNLDKQREKKAAAKKATQEQAEREKAAQEKAAREKAAREKAEKEKAAQEQAAREKAEKEKAAQEEDARRKAAAKKAAAPKKAAPKSRPAEEPESSAGTVKPAAPKKRRPAEGEAETAAPKKPVKKRPAQTPAEGEAGASTPKKKRRPAEGEADATAPKRPVKKRPAQTSAEEPAEEKRYSNIPPEKVRTKHGNAARKGYEDMLATGEIGKVKRKKKFQEDEDDTKTIEKITSSKAADSKKTAVKAAKKAKPEPEPEVDNYDDDDYYEDAPRFRAMRVVLALLSLAGFGFLMYKGFTTGLSATEAEGTVSGLTFVILGLCLLVSALLYFITLGTNSVFAFLLPMLFYLGGGVFAFLKRGDELQLLIAAGVCAVLAVISLILAITSRGGDDEDDYDDAFEDDYADEDFDD